MRSRLLCEVEDPGSGAASRRAMLAISISTCSLDRSESDECSLIVEFTGELDAYSSGVVGGSVLDLVDIAGDVVIDMGAIDFIDVAGLKLLEAIVETATRHGGSTYLHADSRSLRRVLDVVDVSGLRRCSHPSRGASGSIGMTSGDLADATSAGDGSSD